MIDERDLFVQASMRFSPPSGALETFNRRRLRKRRNQRIAALAVGVIVAAVVFAGLARVILQSKPTPAAPPSIFDQVHGWIAVGTSLGVEAVNPQDPSTSVLLSSVHGEPFAWSRDGSQLLLRIGQNLSVLRSDGSVVPVPSTHGALGIGFTADGSEVVADRRTVYAVNLGTGQLRTLFSPPSKRDYVVAGAWTGGPPLGPSTLAVIPGGFDPVGAHGLDLSLLNLSDGSLRLLVKKGQARRLLGTSDFSGILPGTLSPDGSRVVFTTGSPDCMVAVVNANGTGLTRLSTQCGLGPSWSPDGSQIAGTNGTNQLRIMNADGSGVRMVPFKEGGSPFLFAA